MKEIRGSIGECLVASQQLIGALSILMEEFPAGNDEWGLLEFLGNRGEFETHVSVLPALQPDWSG